MRNLKKILAMALTVLMVVGSFAMTATAAFDDVTDYQEAIEVMAALGIAAGKSETEFAPDDDVTREEMALWIAKIMTGKVAADYVTNNFLGAVENLTAFADLDEDNYVGAINYATNNGIIVGTSATTFEPAEAIKIQDVFAMVVRMLGYGSTAMNNNYPWSFIDKAISLGLDADLPADYSNEAVASRGETMQILYNALTALKSDGSTLGYDFFGLEKATVVITGTSEGNMYTGADLVTKTVDDVDYVAFSILNANGTVAANNATYYALKTAFGIDAAAPAEFYVGNSYVVRTVDGFASFLTCEACESVVVDQDVITGDMTAKSPANTYVDVDGTSYKLVDAYSEFIKNNDTEIIFNQVGKRVESYDLGSYVMDADLNILAADGVKVNNEDGILLYWKSTQGSGNTYANLNGMYLYMLSDGTFIQPTDYIWSLAKKATAHTTDATGFSAILNSNTGIEKLDAYSNTVLYDDDADGDYDRAIYVQYKFAKVVDNSSKKYASTDASGQKTADVTIYDAEGNVLSYADIDDKYVLYWYNPLYKTLIVKEIFEGQTGLVTGVDLVNSTLTLNAFGANIITGVITGETYTLGNEKLSGAQCNDIKKSIDGTDLNVHALMGKNINFIEKDGKILAIYDAVASAGYMVYVKDEIGYTTMGYENILAYYDVAAGNVGATQAVVTVNAVNGYWYSNFNQYVANAPIDAEDYAVGNVLKVTKDALGHYDIIGDGADIKVTVPANNRTITINNGIVSGAGITPFVAKASTVWVIYDGNGINGFKTFKGIPNDNATITVNATGELYVVSEKFVYVKGGSADGTTSVNPWGNDFNQNSTVIYADMTTIASMQMVSPNGMYVGATFSYTKAIDMINGGYASVVSSPSYNAALEVGNFYEVKNGYIVDKIDLDNTTLVSKGYLLGADKIGAIAPKWGYKLIANVDDETTYYATNATTVENAALPTLYYNNVANDTYGDAPKDILVKANYTSTTDTVMPAAYALLNDATDDGYDTALVVYYAKTGNAPIFLAVDDIEIKNAKDPDPATSEYNVQFYALDTGLNADGSHKAAATYQAYDVDKLVNFYVGGKNASTGAILFNEFATIDMLNAQSPHHFYCHQYANVDSVDELPIIIISMKKEFVEQYNWDIAFTKQGGADVRYDSSVSLKGDLLDFLGTNKAEADVVYFALQITDDMIRYNNDMTIVDLDADANNTEYDIDVCFWVTSKNTAK